MAVCGAIVTYDTLVSQLGTNHNDRMAVHSCDAVDQCGGIWHGTPNGVLVEPFSLAQKKSGKYLCIS
jgi:hypothetical protein